MTLLNLQNIDQ